MPLVTSAFRLLLTGYLLAISKCQENATLTSDAAGTTITSLTTLLSNTSIRDTTTLRPISGEPEFSIGTVNTNSDRALNTTLISQSTTATVDGTTSGPSAAVQSETINDRIATQITTPERPVNSTSETTTVLTSPRTTISEVQSTSASVTTQQGTITCTTATQLETTTQSILPQVTTNNSITDAVAQSSAETASTLAKFEASTSSPPGSIPSGSTSSSESLTTSKMVSTSRTPMPSETSSSSSTFSRESELQEHRTTSFKMTTVTPFTSENTTTTDETTNMLDNSTESDGNGTEAPTDKDKKEYLSMYARNITLVVVIMFLLNIMSLSIAIFIFSRIAKRSHRWDRPPSRCGSNRQYFISKPPPPSPVACTLIRGRNLANDAECQEGESTRESVPVVTKDAGWCVPLPEEKKKVNQDQRAEEDTGV